MPGSGRTAAGSREAEAMSRCAAALRDPREWRWLVCEKGRACAFTTFDLLGTRAAKDFVIAGGRSLSYTDAAAVTNGLASRLVARAASRAPALTPSKRRCRHGDRSRVVDVVAAVGAGTIGGEAAIHALPTFLQRSIKRPSHCAGRPGQGYSPANSSVEDAARARPLQGESGVVAVEDRRQRRFLGHPAVADPVQHVGRVAELSLCRAKEDGRENREPQRRFETRRHPVRATRGTAGAPVLPGAATRSPARCPGLRGRETGSRRRGPRPS